MIGIALEVGPDQVTLVPEKREELTTEGGLDVASEVERLTDAVERLDWDLVAARFESLYQSVVAR